jgi:hypothetical protein
MATKSLGQLRHSIPTLRASASPREIPHPSFLDCGGLTPLWIFPSTRSIPIQGSAKPEHSMTPSLPQNILGNCGTQSPTLRASAPPREIPDPSFLDCGGLTPLWIFPFDPLYSHPKLRQAGALQDTLIAPKHLGQLRNSIPTLRVSASPREIPHPSFLDCGGLTPLWIFPSTRSTPSPARPAGALQDPLMAPKRLGNCGTWAIPNLSRLCVRFRILLSWTAVAGHRFGFSPSKRSIPIPSSVKPEHSRTPSWPQNALGNCGTWTTPTLSRLRVRFRILLSWTAVAGHRFGFSHQRARPHPKLRQAGALQDTLTAPKRLGNCGTWAIPNLSRLCVRFRILLSWTAVA